MRRSGEYVMKTWAAVLGRRRLPQELVLLFDVAIASRIRIL